MKNKEFFLVDYLNFIAKSLLIKCFVIIFLLNYNLKCQKKNDSFDCVYIKVFFSLKTYEKLKRLLIITEIMKI